VGGRGGGGPWPGRVGGGPWGASPASTARRSDVMGIGGRSTSPCRGSGTTCPRPPYVGGGFAFGFTSPGAGGLAGAGWVGASDCGPNRANLPLRALQSATSCGSTLGNGRRAVGG